MLQLTCELPKCSQAESTVTKQVKLCSAEVLGDWEWEIHLEDTPSDVEEPFTLQLSAGWVAGELGMGIPLHWRWDHREECAQWGWAPFELHLGLKWVRAERRIREQKDPSLSSKRIFCMAHPCPTPRLPAVLSTTGDGVMPETEK